MVKVIEGKLDASKLKIGIVVSRFNELVSKGLLDGAVDCLKRHGAKEAEITVVWVPGAFEMPLIVKKIAKKFNAVICLGAIIRGGTPHFEYVASEAAKGIAQVSLDTGVPVIFGVLTTETMAQALDRVGGSHGHKGRDAADAALEMIQLMREFH